LVDEFKKCPECGSIELVIEYDDNGEYSNMKILCFNPKCGWS